MKRWILPILLFFALTFISQAQPKSVGIRLGGECQISYQHNVGRGRNFIEFDMGVQALGKGLSLAGAYDFMIAQPTWTQKGQWGFYAGPAVKLAYVWMGGYLVAGAQIGLEYTFDIPLQISLDVRPAIGVAMEGNSAFFFGGEVLYGTIPAISLRYRF